MTLVDQLSDLLPILPPFEVNKIEKDDIADKVMIHLVVSESNTPINHRIHSYYEREWKHLKLFQYRTYIRCKIPIYQDKTTKRFTKPIIEFSRDYSGFTLLYEAEVMPLMGIHHCFTTVGANLGIYPQRVESIYHYHTQHLEDNTLNHTPVNIAYDETSTRKGHDYITTFFDLDQ